MCYLPAGFGDVFEIREMIFNPRVDVFQCHAPFLSAVDGKLDHGHVGVRGAFGDGGSRGGSCRDFLQLVS